MKRPALLVLAFLSMPAWATTYYFAGGPYTTRFDHQTCSTGVCADYPAGARITGSFTTAAPLAANLPATEITPLVTSYSFNDGVNAYSSADANARIERFSVQTDATGKPFGVGVRLQRWQAAAPHNAGNDRLGVLFIGSPTGAGNNATCSSFGASAFNGVPDVCNGFIGSTDTSQGITMLADAWSVDVPIVIPPDVATTYYVASGPYTTRMPHTTCGTGTCADFPLGSRITGSFTTAVPLPANLPAIDVSGLISAYGFSDGVTTYANGDPNVRIGTFQLQTDASGVPGLQQVLLQRWQAAGPHNAGNARFNLLFFTPASAAGSNVTCTTFGTSPAGAADACIGFTGSSDTSQALSQLATRVAIGAPVSLALTPTTYVYTGGTYTTINNHTTCLVGACADYTPAMRVTGSFTTVDRIPANFALADVTGLVASYSFSDGVRTIAGGAPLARLAAFQVGTDAGGVPVDSLIVVEQWQGPAPHGAGSRFDMITVPAAGASAGTNIDCPSGASISPQNGTPDICLSLSTVSDTSLALAPGGGWSIASAPSQGGATPVPTLAETLLALLAVVLAAAGARAARRRAGR